MKKYFIEAFSRSTSSVPCPQCVIRMISMYTRAQVQVEAAAGEMCFTSGELEEAISHPSSAEGKLLKRFSELLKKEICFNWSKIILPPLCVCFAFLCSENESVST